MRGQRLALGGLLVVALLGLAPPAAAHPLGNATANRAVSVTVLPDELRIWYVLDLAEIPAYAALLDLDADFDGRASSTERRRWAGTHCESAAAELLVVVADRPVRMTAAGAPRLTFPPGVGGLETLRLECTLAAPLTPSAEVRTLTITDTADDGRLGWRELTIAAGDGAGLSGSDVPAISPSAGLTAYPDESLQDPIDVRVGHATILPDAAPSSDVSDESQAAPIPSAGATEDAFSSLLGRTDSPMGWLFALGLAVALGAGHALSPGHGKALIAAYLVGSRGTARRAGALGLAVAGSHTVGVFILGAIVLFASELLVPERVVAWLSAASGLLVIVIGATTARRAIRRRADAGNGDHEHGHQHRHGHDDGPSHDHPGDHRHGQENGHPPIREVITLGLAGGVVPSTSALIVLLVAVATGRLVEGLALIGAFGLGMGVVLAGLAVITSLARNGVADSRRMAASPRLRRIATAVPLASAAIIMGAGAVATIGAIGSL